MDLSSGISVPISTVPFHVPVSLAEGRFPLRDIRYYYVTKNVGPNQPRTKLFICHSGFYFSSKHGRCVPGFLHEYILAGASYKLGVNLAHQANINLVGGNMVGRIGPGMTTRIAKMTIGSLEGIQNPKSVFGGLVPMESLPFELAPCSQSGYFPTPDYRFYYVCVSKHSPSSTNDIDNDEEEAESDRPAHQFHSEDDDDEEDDDFNQLAFSCPSDLYFSEFYGFCVAPYIHQLVGLSRLERYLWGSHKYRGTPSQNGIEIPENAIPWEIPLCSKNGKVPLRDPRYFVMCSDGTRKVLLCPTNTYFNSKSQSCVTLRECDCWYKAGHLADPFPKNGLGMEMNILIHLDRAYLYLLRQALQPVVRRSVMAGRKDGKSATMVKKLICFWREMEKFRTLQYQFTSPRTNSSELSQTIPPMIGKPHLG